MNLSGLITALEPSALSWAEHQALGTKEGDALAGGSAPTVASVLAAIRPALENSLDAAITAAGTDLGLNATELQELRAALNARLNAWQPA